MNNDPPTYHIIDNHEHDERHFLLDLWASHIVELIMDDVLNEVEEEEEEEPCQIIDRTDPEFWKRGRG